MAAFSPLDLLGITFAVALFYGAIIWRFVMVPAHRRRTVGIQRVTVVHRSPQRAQLRLVVDNASR